MAVHLTDSACERVREMIREHPDTSWLRLGVRGGGCSGLSYFMDFVAGPGEKDKTFTFGDVQVCVDRKSYLYLNGITLNFEQGLVRRGFIFENPQAKRSCSCGESFAL